MFMMFYIFSMTSLNAQKNEISNVLQKSEKKKVIVKPLVEKRESQQVMRFVFKDTDDANEIGLANKKQFDDPRKSKSYKYDNKSRFKFRFTPGTGDSNIVDGEN